VKVGHPNKVIRTHPSIADPDAMSAYPSPDDRGKNWVAFAAVLFLVVGMFSVFNGIAFLANDDYFAADELLFGDLSMWGTVYLVLGAIQLLTAFLIWRGSVMGALLGIMLAGLSAANSLLSVGAYPIWSLMILALDGVIIYALTVYGTVLSDVR
jgi:hypothetical protein